jgi:hypothetical protein
MENLRAGDLMYMYVDCLGQEVITGVNESLKIIMPVRFVGTDRGDNEGSYETSYTLEPVHSDDFGSWIKVTAINNIPFFRAVELAT